MISLTELSEIVTFILTGGRMEAPEVGVNGQLFDDVELLLQ